MNIKVVYSWLKEYLDTNVSAFDLANYLSLCGPSVERVEKIGKDYILDIEITSNRIDTASVLGIAQESYAILPEFGKSVRFIDKFENFDFKSFVRKISVHDSPTPFIKVSFPGVSRFIAVILKDVKVSSSPEFIRQRLELSGVKSINNVIDISNYVMLELGQPNHIFDYEKLEGGKLILKEAEDNDEIVLLDERKVKLQKGDLIFVDGKDRLVDLCGIMGGFLSAVDEKTSTVLLTIPVYDKVKVRRTSMRTGVRTLAATYFEKGLDEERSEKAFYLAVKLLKEYANAKVASPVFDFYPKPYKPTTIRFTSEEISNFIGVKIPQKKIVDILKRLGFKVKANGKWLVADVPYHRKYDVYNLQDIVEEIARIYGYHNLPSQIQPLVLLKQPKHIENLFKYQRKLKYFLKYKGFIEIMNYSMTSKEIIEKYCNEELKNHIRIANPISNLLVYMRRHLFYSLVENIKENVGEFKDLRVFELAKVYLKKKGASLPEEVYYLSLATTRDFYYLKGILECMLDELNIQEYSFKKSNRPFLDPTIQADLYVKDENLGFIGKIKGEGIYVLEIDFVRLLNHIKSTRYIKPLSKYAVIKLDYNFNLSPTLNFEKIKSIAFKTSSLLQKLELVDVYKKKITLRFNFSNPNRNMTEEEAKEELRKILLKLGLNPQV